MQGLRRGAAPGTGRLLCILLLRHGALPAQASRRVSGVDAFGLAAVSGMLPLGMITLGEVAAVHVERGSFDQAESLRRQALAMLERSLGEDHPSVAKAEYELARVLRAAGQRQSAQPPAPEAGFADSGKPRRFEAAAA